MPSSKKILAAAQNLKNLKRQLLELKEESIYYFQNGRLQGT